MSISDEAVEAAAEVIRNAHPFQSLSGCRAEARAALEAAAPHLIGQGWDEAAAYVRNDMEIRQRLYAMRRIKTANPYRSQA